MMQKNSKILIVAGANGCGKSTIIKSWLEKPEYKDYLYICPDIFANQKALNLKEEYLRVMKLCEELRISAVSKGTSFIMETVLSDKRKLKELEEYKTKYNAYIEVLYIATKSPEINKNRIAKRVREGGHSVPEDKIQSRWERSLVNLKELNSLAEKITIYDSSIDYDTKLIYQRDSFTEVVLDDWIIKYLTENKEQEKDNDELTDVGEITLSPKISINEAYAKNASKPEEKNNINIQNHQNSIEEIE